MGHGPEDSPLGKTSSFEEVYNPALLFAIPRSDGREALELDSENLPFRGMDIWNAYELSWLDSKGKPHVAIAEIQVPCNSLNIVESKSLKLYFGSFNQTPFNTREEVIRTIESDLSVTVRAPVMVRVIPVNQCAHEAMSTLPGECIDEVELNVKGYDVHPEVLRVESGPELTETLHSHLLRSNCPVTGQPDWASVMIRYRGQRIPHECLLRYIISYRKHSGFHEQCVEQIFCDIQKYCNPSRLSVYARYTRRGGIDINPFRSNFEDSPGNIRLLRQ